MKESITSVHQLRNLKPLNFVLYYSNGCGYCHMFENHWADIVSKIKSEALSVKPISIESKHFGDLGKINFFNSVSGVPTLSLVDHKGSFVKKFEGERNPETIMEWLKTHAPKSITGKSRRLKSRHRKSNRHGKSNRRGKSNRLGKSRRHKKSRSKHKKRKTNKIVILE